MRFLATLAALAALLLAAAAHADQPEAREIARLNNCPPKKIEIYQSSLGQEGRTIYRVECTMPKAVGTADSGTPPPDALLIGCDESLCQLLGPAAATDKK